jgi:hypothetical protein
LRNPYRNRIIDPRTFSGEDASSESSDAAKQWEAAIRQALMPVQTPAAVAVPPAIKAEKESQAVAPESG